MSSNIRSLLWLSQPLSSLCWACKYWHAHFSYHFGYSDFKNRENRCFYVRDTFLNSHLMPGLCHALRNKSEFQTVLFSNPSALLSWKRTSRYISNMSFTWWSLKLKIVYFVRAHQQFPTYKNCHAGHGRDVPLVTPFMHCHFHFIRNTGEGMMDLTTTI